MSALKDQPFGEVTQPAVAINDHGTTFTVLFDRVTHLPVAVRTRDDDHVYGDSDYDLVMDDWRDVGGVKIAHALSYQLNGMGVQRLAYSEVKANPQIAADALSVGDYHLAKVIGWTLLGHPIDDAQMVELLEPLRPHRYRAVRLLEVSGLARNPRFGPRRAVRNLAAL